MARGFILAALASVALLGGNAQAQNAKKESITEAAKKKGPRKVLRLEGDVIVSKAQKPEAFYLLNRASLSFEGLKLETKMTPKILRQLRKPPF